MTFPPRTLAERRSAAEQRLSDGGNMWLATAGGGGPHLIPVSYWWDGSRLLTATYENSRTHANIGVQPRVRVSVGETTDVLMIDATARVVPDDEVSDVDADGYAAASRIPRGTPGFVYVRLEPRRVQVWRGPEEFDGRTVMRAGRWLDDPAG